MPWQADPVVNDAPSGGGGWQADPVVEEAPAPSKPSSAEAFGRGAVQGSTLGFGDELGAGMQALWTHQAKSLPRGVQEWLGIENIEQAGSPLDVYRQARDENRQLEQRAREAEPLAYGAGSVVGGLPAAAVAPGYAGAALTGAAAGLGASEADLTKGKVGEAALDTALGAGAGLAGEGLGRAVAKPLGALASAAGRKVGAAGAKLKQLAAERFEKEIAQAAGALGGEVQKANRFVENLMRLGETGTPQQRAELARLEQAGVLQKLREQLLGSNLADLPGQEALINERRATLQELQRNAPQLLARYEQEIASPWAQLKPRIQRYLAPAVGSIVGGSAGAAVGGGLGLALGGGEGGRFGAAVGGLAGAGLRPGARALARMAQHPAIAGPVAQAVQTGSGALARWAPMLSRAAAESPEALLALHQSLLRIPEYAAALEQGGNP